MLELIWIVIVGAVVGAVAKLVMPGPDPGGMFVATLLGMGGRVHAPLREAGPLLLRAGREDPGCEAPRLEVGKPVVDADLHADVAGRDRGEEGHAEGGARGERDRRGMAPTLCSRP